jgi:hypothetical protein
MSYSSSTSQAGAPLGVGAIVSESFSILMRHFMSVVLLAIVPTLISIAISGVLQGWGVALGQADPQFTGGASLIPFALSIIGQLVMSGVTTALLMQLAYDAKLERPLVLGKYVGPAISAAIPIAVLGLLAGILVGFAAIALILPGLWLYAVFSVMPAAVVIEKAGFGGLGRSASLTKEYRWPILGAIILIFIVNFLISVAALFLVGLLISAMGGSTIGVVIGVLAFAALSAVGVGLGSIAIALIYARLREIKEGTSVRDIVAVFD